MKQKILKTLKLASFFAILLFFVAGSTISFAGSNSSDTDEPDTDHWTLINFNCIDHNGDVYSTYGQCFRLGDMEHCQSSVCPEDTTPDPKPDTN